MLTGSAEYKYNYRSNAITRAADTEVQGALLFSSASKTANAPDSNIAVYFDVITQHSIQINDNITDNWLENSTVVNDSIAQSPITVTLSGVSGELVYVPSTNKGWLRGLYTSINDRLAGRFTNDYVITDKLTVIPELLPPVDNITQQARNMVTVIEDNVKRYEKIINNFVKNKEQRDETRLRNIYKSLAKLREMCKTSGEGLTVETPFGELNNMFIQSLTLTQGSQAHIMDISVTLKQINFSDVKAEKANAEVYAEFNANARAAAENHGKVQGKYVSLESTLLGSIFVKAGAAQGGGVKRD